MFSGDLSDANSPLSRSPISVSRVASLASHAAPRSWMRHVRRYRWSDRERNLKGYDRLATAPGGALIAAETPHSTNQYPAQVTPLFPLFSSRSSSGQSSFSRSAVLGFRPRGIAFGWRRDTGRPDAQANEIARAGLVSRVRRSLGPRHRPGAGGRPPHARPARGSSSTRRGYANDGRAWSRFSKREVQRHGKLRV